MRAVGGAAAWAGGVREGSRDRGDKRPLPPLTLPYPSLASWPHLVEASEDLLFGVHVFEDRLDHEINARQRGVVRRARDESARLIDCRLRLGAALDGAAIVRIDQLEAAREAAAAKKGAGGRGGASDCSVGPRDATGEGIRSSDAVARAAGATLAPCNGQVTVR